ncbi:GntR family transcriptional regulator [Paenibacillus spongiae]|uniref:GntR family transcriptional regulator n=1 Tax=Paenibacillus spongiae TaxID=2909671 RepID=A0ABY5S6R8_9BACL|nr:GntR family transcriptional regulator [Paenibacillus spongiae]UVI28542.1 GntR family transcriptional regulator [Paenibacillus spongiae]
MVKATKPHLLTKQSISGDLVELIKNQILEGELNPGDRIVETKLAKDYGISQTPVREAIRQLSGEGIIVIVPNRGPQVRELRMKDVFEIYSLRAVYEGLAIRLAVMKATDDDVRALQSFYEQMKAKVHDDSVSSLLPDSLHIHQTIIELSSHERLIAMYRTISFQISLVNRILGSASTKEKEAWQHLELIEALSKRDPDEAENVMRSHIYRSYCEFADMRKATDPEFDNRAWF